jgi:hypothetical protein
VCSLPENWEELATYASVRLSKKVLSLKEAEMLARKGLEFVTDTTIIDIKKAASVTPERTPGTTELQPEPIGKMGWINRWGKWVRASFLEVAGTQYRMLIGELENLTDTLAWPDKIRWDVAAI